MQKVIVSPNYNVLKWIVEDDLSILISNTLKRGWLGFYCDNEFYTGIILFVKSYGPILSFISMVIQASALLIFKRRFFNLIIIGFISFNVIVFLLSGIFFWKWILANICLIFLIKKLNKEILIESIWQKKYFVLGLIFIPLSWFYSYSVKLGWYQLNASRYYHLEVVSDDNKEYSVTLHKLAPYDLFFTSSRWNLFDDKELFNSTQSYDIFQKGLKVTDFEKMKEFNKLHGKNLYKQERAEKILEFIKLYFQSYNEAKLKSVFWNGIIAAPKHIYRWGDACKFPDFQFDKKVSKVRIIYRTCVIDEKGLIQCNDEQLNEIEIDIN